MESVSDMDSWLKLQFFSFVRGDMPKEIIDFFVSKGFGPVWKAWMKNLKSVYPDYIDRVKAADEEAIEDMVLLLKNSF